MTDDFLAEARHEQWRNQRHARLNHHLAFAVLLLSIIGSFAAAVLIALDVPKIAVVAVSALPGTMLVLNATLKFDAKALWHHRKVHEIAALARAVRFEGLPVAEASARLSRLASSLERTYPGFEAMPARTPEREPA